MQRKVLTPNYNYVFDTQSGLFARWGKDAKDDPSYSPIGPEILDIEVSTVCHKGCTFCYKSNTGSGTNMSFDTFKVIIDKMPTVMQIAFGIGDIDSNEDLYKMFEYCRSKNIVPNVTINGTRMKSSDYYHLAQLCGAIAVSLYNYEDTANAVKELTDRGMKQVNIHAMLSLESLPRIVDFLSKYKQDARFDKLNAIVFLSLKQKGRGKYQHPVLQDGFNWLMDYLFKNNVTFGADSCTANKIINYISTHKDLSNLEKYIEPCESGLFSQYVDVTGKWYPCSFVNEPYFTGIDLLQEGLDFLQDVWYNDRVIEWRKKLIKCGRSCPIYKV